jgi:hypothetical protein
MKSLLISTFLPHFSGNSGKIMVNIYTAKTKIQRNSIVEKLLLVLNIIRKKITFIRDLYHLG